ncbi:RraA family protein [Novosphingobium sp.]|jgi:regulator of RNase E activity RraA|uniref:RraA family protein n=1 Tax=Novosphingobium sp. TaxID=1874826 RepID=UPI0022BC5F9C|nr:RraA family protein [Novosphingobium sp.]MCZ8018657.1 RraA family protein [Novosphingobium sp.]MCZ8034662.1 RraA family protein [Novosphingobium sp.]MCZ8052797.1 RraA family protein [Novosphingobium sp.]MCZ8060555.1 RraA family protein [Novosphingobium sp.]MCZ8230581.1 RraA family protein [Novosphingobium sp.]
MDNQQLSSRLTAVGITAISDALDKLGIEGQAVGIMPVVRTMRFAGPAFTIRMLPVGLTGGVVGDYIDDVPAGAVVTIDNKGIMDQTVWGDILTFVAHSKGIAGTVIDGVCRDSDRCVELGYPVFARSNTMRTGKDRTTADAYNVPIQIAGVRVNPGDWLVGDADGVVAIPADCVVDVIEAAESIEAIEQRIRDAVASGMRLDEARKSLNYHGLQTRVKD